MGLMRRNVTNMDPPNMQGKTKTAAGMIEVETVNPLQSSVRSRNELKSWKSTNLRGKSHPTRVTVTAVNLIILKARALRSRVSQNQNPRRKRVSPMRALPQTVRRMSADRRRGGRREPPALGTNLRPAPGRSLVSLNMVTRVQRKGPENPPAPARKRQRK